LFLQPSNSLTAETGKAIRFMKLISTRRTKPVKRQNIKPADTRHANGFLSAVLCIMLFIFSCAFLALFVVRAENTARLIKNIDITGYLANTDIAYYIVHQINALPFNDAEISFTDVENFIMNEAVIEEIGDVVVGYARALARGDMDHHLTPDDIINIAQNLDDEIYELFDHRMTEAEYELLARTLDDVIDFRGLSVGGIIEDVEDFGVDTTFPRLILSSYLLWGAGILCAVTLFIIFMHHRRKISNAFLGAGITIILSGLVFIVAGVIVGSYPEMLSEALYRFTRFTDGLVFLVTRYGMITAAVGVLSVAVSLVLKILDYSNRNSSYS